MTQMSQDYSGNYGLLVQRVTSNLEHYVVDCVDHSVNMPTQTECMKGYQKR